MCLHSKISVISSPSNSSYRSTLIDLFKEVSNHTAFSARKRTRLTVPWVVRSDRVGRNSPGRVPVSTIVFVWCCRLVQVPGLGILHDDVKGYFLKSFRNKSRPVADLWLEMWVLPCEVTLIPVFPTATGIQVIRIEKIAIWSKHPTGNGTSMPIAYRGVMCLFVALLNT